MCPAKPDKHSLVGAEEDRSAAAGHLDDTAPGVDSGAPVADLDPQVGISRDVDRARGRVDPELLVGKPGGGCHSAISNALIEKLIDCINNLK